MRKDIFPSRTLTSREDIITRFMQVMRKWAPNNTSKLKKMTNFYIIIISVPSRAIACPSYKMLSADFFKKTLTYPYSKKKVKTLM